jgi:hypothetical protein
MVLSTEHTHFYSDNMQESHLHLSYLFRKYARESFTFITFTPAKGNTDVIAFVPLKLNWLQRCKNNTKQSRINYNNVHQTSLFAEPKDQCVQRCSDSLYPYEGCVACSGRRTSLRSKE